MKQEALEMLLEDLSLLSGVRVSLYDNRHRCIAGNSTRSHAAFCATIQNDSDALTRCFRSDLDAFAVAEKNRKPYVFTCPFGLFEAVVPLYDGDNLLGFLFAGEALVPSPGQQERVLRAILPHMQSRYSEDALRELIAAVPTPSPAACDALVRTMTVFGKHIVSCGLPEDEPRELSSLVRLYLDRNFHRKLTLAELSLHFHCSTVTLTEAFRRAFSCTIMSYLTERRLAAAVELLENSALGMEAIAEKCGFSGAAYFSKVFKQRFGLSPLYWRTEKKNAQILPI